MTQHENSALCSWCGQLELRKFFSLPLITSTDQLNAVSGSRNKRCLERPSGDLLAASDCPLCTLIHQTLGASEGFLNRRNKVANPILQYTFRYGLLPGDTQAIDTYHYLTDGLEVGMEMEVPRLIVSIPGHDVQVRLQRQQDPVGAGRDGLFRGRTVGSYVDMALLKLWLAECNATHQCLRGQPTTLTDWIIDVEGARLIRWDAQVQHSHYAALSYVWGDPETVEHLTNTTLTLPKLTVLGGLSGGSLKVPHTIRDAMHLCSLLGIRFLWIDALCIKQDTKLLSAQLDGVRGIYEGAYVTIACVDGPDSWHGLPGVGKTARRQLPTPTCFVEGVPLGVAPSPASKIRQGVWNTRGWTYQEEIVSRRILYFTDDEVLFACDNGILWRESVQLEPADVQALSQTSSQEYLSIQPQGLTKPCLPDMLKVFSSPDVWEYPEYIKHLQRYLDRTLGDPGDALRAVEGISQAYAACMDTQLIRGQLASHLTDLLHFTYSVPIPSASSKLFPSWSWSHWQGELRIDHQRKKVRRDVAWYRISSRRAGFRAPGDGYPVVRPQDHGATRAHSDTFRCVVRQLHERDRYSDLLDNKPDMLTLELPLAAQAQMDNLLFGQVQHHRVGVSRMSLPGTLDTFEIIDGRFRSDLHEPRRTIRLCSKWRVSQPDELEFVRISHEQPFANYFGNGGNAVVNTLLIETDKAGLSKRIHLHQFLKNNWNAEPRPLSKWICLC